VIWAKRQFPNAEFGRYHDRLIKLLYRFPVRYREFIMVSAKTQNSTARTYYVGVPTDVFMTAFDGFDVIRDQDLPDEIDTLIVGDVASEEFKNRFQFRRDSSGSIGSEGQSFPSKTVEQLDIAK
jgi:hypothetical protein